MSRLVIGRVETVVIDVNDIDRAVKFWAGLLGFEGETPRNGWAKIGDISPGIRLILQQVPERKDKKNRVHLDVQVDDLDKAVQRVKKLGGSVRKERDDGLGRFFNMFDPEGNEFCLVSPSPTRNE